MSQSNMLEVAHLWKVFGPGNHGVALDLGRQGLTRAEVQQQSGQTIGVRDVSFDVAAGETFVVMGLSGSGKSTLIRCLARLHEPTDGSILLDGTDLVSLSDEALREVRRHKVAMVFQHFGLFPHRTVIDNAAYGLEVQGIGRTERHRRAGEVLDTVGLSAWAGHYPQQLSGGMQQRVGLARALVLDPDLLFFDEPFSALDPLIRKEMQDELVRLQRDTQRTIVFITHDFDEALRLGDRIAIMKDGVFDQIGTPEEIVRDPATDYVREFTNDVPKARVLTAASIMRAAGPGETTTRSTPGGTRVEALIPDLLRSGATFAVTDAAGVVLGIVDRDVVAEVIEPEIPPS